MLWLHIDRSLNISLTRQVYEQIRMKILHGELAAGERLPSTREFAAHLKVSRNVIIEAYEQLLTEGYTVGQQGSGTFVAEGTFLNHENKGVSLDTFTKPERYQRKSDIIDFRSGIPALDQFPRKVWGDIAKKVSLEAPNSLFGYGYPEGHADLRNVLARYLMRMRGVYCHPDQLVITAGATQAFSLLTNLLLSPGDEVIIEDPITQEIQTIFTSRGSVLHPIPVDENGMKTDLLPASLKPKFVFVTPSHQFPLGATLPIQRRIQLIQFARKADCYIIEDDYDSEFRYDASPINSLQGLDPNRVVYIGTFSKILSPALRLGYLILPAPLVEQCKNLKWFTDLHTPALEQLTLAQFISERHLERHIKKMKKTYQSLRDHLIKCLRNEFQDKVKISGHSTGLHLIAEFIGISIPEDELEETHKVKIYPVEQHTIQKGYHKNKYIIGYGNLTKQEIEEGARRIRGSVQHLV